MRRFAFIMALLGVFSFLGVKAYSAEQHGAAVGNLVYKTSISKDATDGAKYQEVYWPQHHRHWSGHWGYRPYHYHYGYRGYYPYYSYYPYYGGYYSYYPYYYPYSYYGYYSPGVSIGVPGFGLALNY